ncbi:hypothetical protein [Bacteroides sp. 519]|uniref:hypothetical protein n=1 Tax=Bacteroides sp. 519 TaxID=2302937 RepID=UPI0013D3A581|nr:hypothetical protein [Bacteroides sp. 519]NDV60571.1 hypothetical protein [Bacteroides sp. 519]
MKRDMIHEFLNRKIMAAVAVAAFAFGLSSCTVEEEIDTPGQFVDGKVQLTLHTNAGSYQMPVTRVAAGNDTDGNVSYSGDRRPIVLVFELPVDKTDMGDAVFKEAARANSESKVALKPTDRPVRLLIVSDPPDNFFYNNQTYAFTVAALNSDESPLKGVTKNKTFAEAVTGILNTVKLTVEANGHVKVPYAGATKYIPASGICDLTEIDEDTSIGTDEDMVKLRRIAAKITVVNQAAGFVLQGATVLNTKQYGYLYRDTISGTPSGLPTGNKVHYLNGDGTDDPDTRVTGIAASSSAVAGEGNTSGSPLYIYESAAGEITVLVQGKFKYNDTPYWYRLALKDKDGNPIAVDRNTHYTLTITEVSMRGYGSIKDALDPLDGTDVTGGVSYEVLSSGLSDHEIVDNGVYYLGLSNSEFIHWSNNTTNVEVLTTISTDAPKGTPIVVEKIAGAGGITLIDGSPLTSGSGKLTGTVPEDGTPIEVRATFQPGFAVNGDGKMALYSITVGVLEKQLLVVQRGNSLFIPETPTDVKGKYVAASVEDGQEWLSLAIKKNDGYKYTTNDVSSNQNGDTLRVYSNVLQMSRNDQLTVDYGTIMASHTPTKDTVTAVGTKKFVNTGGRVKMAIAQQRIIVHRFAKSNVVLYVDGDNRILTFAEDEADYTKKIVEYQDVNGAGKKTVTFSDDTDTNTHTALKANVQGIIFRWGGLVGISTSSNGTNLTSLKPTDVVFWPIEYEKEYMANYGRNPSQVSWKFNYDTWNGETDIPYFGDINYNNLSNDRNYDAFKTKYKDKGYNAAEGYGDICRYISDKGWVKGDWRMPTMGEFSTLRTETINAGYLENVEGYMQIGVLYGEYDYAFDDGPRTDWKVLKVTNPNPSGHYGFTRLTNARMVGAGITPDDNTDKENPDSKYNKYLTDPVGARVVVPAAGANTDEYNWKGGLYYPGGNGYFMSSTPNNYNPAKNNVYTFHVNAVLTYEMRGLGVEAYSINRGAYGVSVRCIRKWPDEL